MVKSSSPKLIAKAALFNEQGELLLLTRSITDDIRPGDYDFPGGAVNKKEETQDAVLREIREEIGLSLTKNEVELKYVHTGYRNGESAIRFLYVGKLIGSHSIRLSHEHDAYSWMQLDEAFNKFDHPVWMGGLKYLKDNQLI